MFLFGKKAGPTLGLDINSSTISVIQLEQAKADTKVTKFSSMPTPPDVVREGLLADPEAVGVAVRELLDLVGIPNKKPIPVANVGIPGQSVVIRLMPVPMGMPADELADVVRQEAMNNLPFPLEEANLDYAILPATERTDPDGVKRMDVILAAIQRNVVDAYWRMCDTAEIKLGKLDISSLAVVRALAGCGMLSNDNNLQLSVNIRNDATDITLVKKGMPLFSRSVLLGVETIGEAISRSIDAPIDEAISLLPKLQLGSVPTADPKLGQAGQVARSVFGDLTAEVGRSLEFYQSQVGVIQVDQLILGGPGCLCSGLDEFVSNRLNIRTTVADPFANLIYDAQQITDERRPQYTMLVGLVNESTVDDLKTVSVNLNKSGPSMVGTDEGGGGEEYGEEGEEEAEEVDTPWFGPGLAVGVLSMLACAGAWGFYSMYVSPQNDAKLIEVNNEIDQAKQQIDKMSAQQEENAALKQKLEILQRIVMHGTPRAAVMQTIRDCTPQGLQVTSVELNDTSLNLAGNTIAFNKASHMSINLSGSNLLDEVKLLKVRRFKKAPDQVGFNIAAIVKPEASAARVSEAQISDAAKSPSGGSGGKPKVLDFFATWCGPCKQLAPIMEEAKKKYGSTVEFVTVDVDDPKNKALVEKYNVHSIPDVYFLDGAGNVSNHISGFGGSGEPIYAELDKLSKLAGKGSTK